jgi:hypothetical protein
MRVQNGRGRFREGFAAPVRPRRAPPMPALPTAPSQYAPVPDRMVDQGPACAPTPTSSTSSR